METGREFLLTDPVASPSQSESWILIVGGGPIGGAVPNIAIHYIIGEGKNQFDKHIHCILYNIQGVHCPAINQ